MTPAISQVCTLYASFEKDLEDFAAAHVPAVEIWLGKLETFLESHSVDEARRLFDEHGIAAPVASFQGGLLTTQSEARREAWDLFRRRLTNCRDLGIDTLVVAADIAGPLTQADLDRLSASLCEAANLAGEHGRRVALEFQSRASYCNNLQTCAAVVAETGSQNLGICLDAFHYYTGPSKEEDLALLSADNLFHVQICDLAGRPRELATDADRVLPGDGDVPLAAIVERLREISYDGPVSVELMNPQIWRVPPLSVGEIAITALRKLLGQANMGPVGK